MNPEAMPGSVKKQGLTVNDDLTDADIDGLAIALDKAIDAPGQMNERT